MYRSSPRRVVQLLRSSSMSSMSSMSWLQKRAYASSHSGSSSSARPPPPPPPANKTFVSDELLKRYGRDYFYPPSSQSSITSSSSSPAAWQLPAVVLTYSLTAAAVRALSCSPLISLRCPLRYATPTPPFTTYREQILWLTLPPEEYYPLAKPSPTLVRTPTSTTINTGPKTHGTYDEGACPHPHPVSLFP